MLFITINSLGEETGGGIYARTLHSGLSRIANLSSIAKRAQHPLDPALGSVIQLRKGPLQDLLARAILCPAFTGFHLFTLLAQIRKHDIVVFHNSRQGGLLALARILFPSKKFVMCFDNVEQLLLASYRSPGSVKAVMDRIDAFLMPFIERWAYRKASACTFITRQDADFFASRYGPREFAPLVIPVALPGKALAADGRTGSDSRLVVLFTASFLFPPNIAALGEIMDLSARARGGYEFWVAGRGLDRVVDEGMRSAANCRFFSDPSVERMEEIFSAADLYLAPVRQGSGMKTKVAEALSHGLPVLATEHALIGYEEVRGESFIHIFDTLESCLQGLDHLSQSLGNNGRNLRLRAHEAFTRFYSVDAVELHFRSLQRLLDMESIS